MGLVGKATKHRSESLAAMPGWEDSPFPEGPPALILPGHGGTSSGDNLVVRGYPVGLAAEGGTHTINNLRVTGANRPIVNRGGDWTFTGDVEFD